MRFVLTEENFGENIVAFRCYNKKCKSAKCYSKVLSEFLVKGGIFKILPVEATQDYFEIKFRV